MFELGLISWLYITAGVTALAGLQLSVVAFFSSSRALYLSCAGFSFSIASYQLGYAYSLQSAVLEQSVSGLKWQTGSALMMVVTVFLFIALYSRQRRVYGWFALLLLFCTLMLAVNYASDNSLRFSEIEAFIPYLAAGGETLYLIRGVQSPYGLAVHFVSQALILWLLYRSIVVLRQGRLIPAVLLLSYFVAVTISAIYGYMIDAGVVQGFYPVGFTASFLVVLVTISLAYDFKVQGQDLKAYTSDLAAEVALSRQLADENLKWVQVIEQSPDAVVVLDLNGQVKRCNWVATEFWRADLGNLPGVDFLGLLNLSFDSFDDDLDRTVILKLDRRAMEYGLMPPGEVWVRFRVFPVLNINGAVSEIVIAHVDISEEVYVKRAIENIATGVSCSGDSGFFDVMVKQLTQTFQVEYAFIGYVVSRHGRLRVETTSFCDQDEIVDNIEFDIADSPFEQLVKPTSCAFPKGVQQLFPDDALLKEMAVEGFVGAPILNLDGTARGILVVMGKSRLQHLDQMMSMLEIFSTRISVETQRLDAESKVRLMAYEDYLTHLPNRAHMHEHLHQVLQEAQGRGLFGALYLIDLDHFKTINDALGHDVGDEVLGEVSRRLRSQLDEAFYIARLGGDEFVVVQSGCQDRQTLEVQATADRLLGLLLKPIQIGERRLNIGGSLGVVVFPLEVAVGEQSEHLISELDLFRYADIALYQAKKSGRNNYVVFEASLQAAVQKRLRLERGIREALDQDQFAIYVQPQVDVDGGLVGVEVLLRWVDAQQKMVSPAEFIPVAEETGLILRIGRWVFDRTFEACSKWQNAKLGWVPRISVNISAWQFAQRSFVDELKSIAETWRVDPGSITLEVTETALLTDIQDTRVKLEQLREFGFRTSLDDFGTGYSSLAYLKDLPIDELKIDKTFIDEVRAGQPQPLVESMLSIGTHLHIDVVAEGVETQAQMDALVGMGCRYFQGYLFAKPMPVTEFPHWLQKHLKNAS